MSKTGGQIVVDALRANKIDHVFSVPGESFLPVLDALYDAPEIKVTIARQEGGASMMADAYGKLTGKPGICLVTRGPGAANAYAGLHVAAQDSTPMILLVGLVGRDVTDREAFQEVDLKSMFGDQAKWAVHVNDTARLPEYLARAFTTAMSGRPGPVVLGLPEDVLSTSVETVASRPALVAQAAPPAPEMERLRDLLSKAHKPLVIAGGETWTEKAIGQLRKFAEQWHLPVASAFRCQDRFPNDHPNYAGVAGLGIDPALANSIRDSDLIIALGARLGDCTTSSYELIDIPYPAQTLVHIHPDTDELGSVYQADLAITSDMPNFLDVAMTLEPPASCAWQAWTSQLNADFHKWTDTATDLPGNFNLGEAIVWLRDQLPDDAIITNGAGNYSVWVHRYYRHLKYRSQLAPTSGSMGYGLPAGIVAKLVHPERTVVVFAGDGCLQMTCQELGTIAENALKVIIVVVNNGMYGTIRMHQEKHYPKRVSGTKLFNPDFVGLAGSYGISAERVTSTDGFAPAMERALAADGPSLIEVTPDPMILTPGKLID